MINGLHSNRRLVVKAEGICNLSESHDLYAKSDCFSSALIPEVLSITSNIVFIVKVRKRTWGLLNEFGKEPKYVY